jgi:hypothetical protein
VCAFSESICWEGLEAMKPQQQRAHFLPHLNLHRNEQELWRSTSLEKYSMGLEYFVTIRRKYPRNDGTISNNMGVALRRLPLAKPQTI